MRNPAESTLNSPMILRGPSRPDLCREECLADIFAATASLHPERPALIWGQRMVSYGELDEASGKIASALRRRGAAPGQVVGLLMPRGADLLITQLGITRSGATWIPLDAETPLERVKGCLESSKACGLVTPRACLARFAALSTSIWGAEDLLREGGADVPEGAKPSDPAYVIYTSGSTGQPKGVVISHRSICHLLRSENELLGIHGGDRVYQGFSVAFDMSFEEIWISYLVGATIWVAPPTLVGDPDLLAQALTRERITVLHAVPTLMGLVDDPLPTLRLINLGGEACPGSLLQRLERPGRRLFNSYGPTETSVSATFAEWKHGEAVSIGMPLPNYGLLVVDEQHRPLPAGEVGELCITGPGLALGYLGRPDLTARRFVPNPLAENAHDKKMYLTGDQARIDPGGPVHCLGRVDSQVKIRGFRVELGEVAAALSSLPGVAAATAVLRPFGDMQQLVAFLVPASDSKPRLPLLRRELASRLPHYMVPSHFEFLRELPRLISGKINTRALCEIPLNAAGPPSAAPENEDEAALYSVLAKLFPAEALDPGLDFFTDLGGHSLLAARLVSLLRDDPRYADLSVQDVYRERRLADIARAMGRRRRLGRQPVLRERSATPGWRRFICGSAQTAVIPFFVLLSRPAKRNLTIIGIVAGWSILMEFLDIYWVVMPVHYPNGPQIHWLDFATLAATVSICGLQFWSRFRRHKMVPVGDLRLEQSLRFENA